MSYARSAVKAFQALRSAALGCQQSTPHSSQQDLSATCQTNVLKWWVCTSRCADVWTPLVTFQLLCFCFLGDRWAPWVVVFFFPSHVYDFNMWFQDTLV
ncbi:hypothetical protein BgiBS90_003482, partial [Biomphalaria glabrata]